MYDPTVESNRGRSAISHTNEEFGMNCSELINDLALCSDGSRSEISDEITLHLGVCPLCRQKVAEYREMRFALSAIKRPAAPAELSAKLQSIAAAAATPDMFSFPVFENKWWRLRPLPLAAGVAATLIIGLGLFNFVLNGARFAPARDNARTAGDRADGSVMLASARSAASSEAGPISASEYARSRMSVAGQSPSINPQGALANLARTFASGKSKTEELVVVANVFGNGLAEITTVVEPSEDSQLIAELRQALDKGEGEPPFVPASMDGRADTMRIVLKFRNVTVNTRRR